MKSKTFEIRDSATFIPVLAVQLEPETEADRYLLARAGFGIANAEQKTYVMLIRLEAQEVKWDYFGWPNQRTMGVAHRYIIEHFDELKNGAVIDVQHILGETDASKPSERVTATLG